MNTFQTAELAKVIAASPLPVILGVGHAQNQFLCKKAAHLPCRTPTDAAASLEHAVWASRKKGSEETQEKTWERKAEIASYEEMIKQIIKERDQSRQEAERLRELLETERVQWAEEKARLEAAQGITQNDRDAGSSSAVARFMGFLRRK